MRVDCVATIPQSIFQGAGDPSAYSVFATDTFTVKYRVGGVAYVDTITVPSTGLGPMNILLSTYVIYGVAALGGAVTAAVATSRDFLALWPDPTQIVYVLATVDGKGNVETPPLVGLLQPQHGTWLMSIPANSESAAHTLTYPDYAFKAGTVPDVFGSSQDLDWIGMAAPHPGAEETQVDLTMVRRISLVNAESGFIFADTVPHGAIPSGSPSVDVTAVFSPDFQAAPIVVAQTNNDQTRVVTVSSSVTVHQAKFRVFYVPPLAAGVVGTNDDGTVTGSVQGSPSTGDQDENHTHLEHDIGGQTGIQQASGAGTSASHQHGLALPGSDHAHLHNPTSGNHAHPFTGSAGNAPSDTAFTLHWTANGTRVGAAVTKNISWLAHGIPAPV